MCHSSQCMISLRKPENMIKNEYFRSIFLFDEICQGHSGSHLLVKEGLVSITRVFLWPETGTYRSQCKPIAKPSNLERRKFFVPSLLFKILRVGSGGIACSQWKHDLGEHVWWWWRRKREIKTRLLSLRWGIESRIFGPCWPSSDGAEKLEDVRNNLKRRMWW